MVGGLYLLLRSLTLAFFADGLVRAINDESLLAGLFLLVRKYSTKMRAAPMQARVSPQTGVLSTTPSEQPRWIRGNLLMLLRLPGTTSLHSTCGVTPIVGEEP